MQISVASFRSSAKKIHWHLAPESYTAMQIVAGRHLKKKQKYGGPETPMEPPSRVKEAPRKSALVQSRQRSRSNSHRAFKSPRKGCCTHTSVYSHNVIWARQRVPQHSSSVGHKLSSGKARKGWGAPNLKQYSQFSGETNSPSQTGLGLEKQASE